MNLFPSNSTLPSFPQLTIERPALLQQLNLILRYRAVVMAAPPGYGKTTCALQFAHQARCPVVWHTVEERERDLPNLMSHCLEAISGIRGDIEELEVPLGSTPAHMATLVTEFLRRALSDHVVYVLDDIHNILGSPNAERWLQALIEGIPPKLHVILIGRSLPTLPLMEMIARHEVLAIGQSQLRFSFQEIQYLAHRMDVTIAPQDIQTIIKQFDGWIAGSLLALQPLPNHIETYFLGEKRAPEALFDALAEEMFHTQDLSLQDFLLASSTLARMTPTLCQDVLQLPRSREHLAEAFHHNLFISQISGGLSYHPLFRAFLQRYLRTHDSLRFTELHGRAASWYEENNRLDETFEHSVSAGHLERAGVLAERYAPAYFSQGKQETVLYWRDQLGERADGLAQLLSICATIHVYRYEYDLAERELIKARREFQSRHDELGALRVDLAQANSDTLRGEPQRAMDLTVEVLKRADIPRNLHGYAHAILGRAYVRLGNIDLAVLHLEIALPLYRETGDQQAVAHLLLALESSYLRIGHFDQGSACLQEALSTLRTLGSSVDLLAPLNNLGESYHLLGDYEQAEQVFQEGLQIAARVSEKRGESYLVSGFADLQRDRGNFSEANSLYQAALRVISAHEPALRCMTLLNFATLRRWQDKLDDALALVDEALLLAEQHHLPLENTTAQMFRTAIGILQGELDGAEKKLGDLTETLQLQTAPTQWARAMMLHANLSLLAGDSATAHQQIKTAIGGIVHETNLQPAVAEIVHTPHLKAFVQLHGSKYPALIKGMARLQAAQVERAVQELESGGDTSTHAFSLRLKTLGQEYLERDGVVVPRSAWRAMDARELFFYLLLKGAATREQLGLVLWEDSSTEQVRRKFHMTLRRARNAVGMNTIRFEEERYFINPDVDVWCDAIELETLVLNARLSSPLRPYTEDLWRRAVEMYEGDLLPSFTASWVMPHREALELMYVEALLALGICIRIRGGYQEALSTLQRAIEIDPYREDVYRAIILCYAALGDRASIHREIDHLTELLNNELGLPPSEETLTLAESLLE